MLPVVVSHSKGGTGDISAANYVARKYGVKSGMWMKQAKQLCPELVVVPYEFEKYEQISKQVYHILFSFSQIVQVCNCYLLYDI